MADDCPPPRRDPTPAEKRKSLLGMLVVIAPLLALAVVMAVLQSRRISGEQAAFAAEMDKWVSPPAAGRVPATPGKLALIDVNKRELHSLHTGSGVARGDLWAGTPREAATIVQLRITDEEIGQYGNGRRAVKQTFHLTVIDKATWQTIGEKSFAGGDPPDSISIRGGSSEPVAGAVPREEILAYLRQLSGV